MDEKKYTLTRYRQDENFNPLAALLIINNKRE